MTLALTSVKGSVQAIIGQLTLGHEASQSGRWSAERDLVASGSCDGDRDLMDGNR